MSKQINEVNQPKSPADKKFKANSVGKTTPDANGNGDEVFKASNVKHQPDEKHGNTDCYKSKEKYDFGQSAGIEESRFRVVTTNPSGRKSVRVVNAPSAQHVRKHFLRMGHHVQQVALAETAESILEQARTHISDRFEKLIQAQPKGAEVTFKHNKTGKISKTTYFTANDATSGVKEMKKRGHVVISKKLLEDTLIEGNYKVNHVISRTLKWKPVKEEVIQEVSKEKLGDYVQAAASDLHNTGRERGAKGNTPSLRRRTFNRNRGISRAVEKLKGKK